MMTAHQAPDLKDFPISPSDILKAEEVTLVTLITPGKIIRKHSLCCQEILGCN